MRHRSQLSRAEPWSRRRAGGDVRQLADVSEVGDHRALVRHQGEELRAALAPVHSGMSTPSARRSHRSPAQTGLLDGSAPNRCRPDTSRAALGALDAALENTAMTA